MNQGDLLARLDRLISERGMTARDVSLSAGFSGDLIRNWHRRHNRGDTFSMTQASLEAVAAVLGVPVAELTGTDPVPFSAPPGFAEDVAPYTPQPSQTSAVQALFSDRARHPQIAYCLSHPMPSLRLATGDLVICDLGRTCRHGDTVIVTVADAMASGRTLLRRWLSPWLLTCDADETAEALRDDSPGVALLYPVVGVIRGT